MGSYHHGLDAILDQVQNEIGLRLNIFNSGGGCMILEARLDGGLWLWVTDYDMDVTPLARRRSLEIEGIDVGWKVGIYPDDPDEAAPSADSCTRLASVEHCTATAEDLPQLVILTLTSLQSRLQHHFGADGNHTVTCGIQAY